MTYRTGSIIRAALVTCLLVAAITVAAQTAPSVSPTPQPISQRATLPPTWTPTFIPSPQPTQTRVTALVTNTKMPTATPPPSPTPTATPANILEMSEDAIRSFLEAAPRLYLPLEHMREIYEQGQSQWEQDTTSVIGVGDCNTVSGFFLEPLHPDWLDYYVMDRSFLDDDSDLRQTVAYFQESFLNHWQSASGGYNAFSVLDSFMATPGTCEANETPLECDIRRYKPVVAFVMFGPNDLNVLTSDQYEMALRTIIETLLDRGVIPVLNTFTYNPEAFTGGKLIKAERHNGIIVALAYEYRIPLLNLWLETADMEARGIFYDNAHLRTEGFAVRNQMAIEILDVVRREIIGDTQTMEN